MNVRNAHGLGLGWQCAVILLLSALLAACASTGRPGAIPPPAPGSSFTISVRSGDTLSQIADRYRVNEDDIVALNRIYDRNVLIVGQILRVPAYGLAGSRQSGETLRAARYERGDTAPLLGDPPRPAPRPNVAIESRELAQPGAVAVAVPRPKPEQPDERTWVDRWFAPPPARPAAQTAALPSQRFLWPVAGQVISNFGRTGVGARNDGINISAPRGTPVRAADAGTVTYVGNELKGYGNLVLIRHDNGYVTAYAHTEEVVVRRGDRVTRGQTIAHTGETGDVNQPQVHFEIRVGTKPVDPRPYLVASN